MDGDIPPTPGAPAPTAPPVPQPPAGPAPTPQPHAPKNDPQDVSSLPDWAQKLLGDTRAEAAKHRTDKQSAAQQAQAAQQQRDAVLKALGLKADGSEDIDPAKLTEQIDQYKAVAWENAVESHVVRLAGAVGYDADALLDSNQFLNSLEALVNEDPSNSDFRALLEKHLKDFVGKHPKFKSANGAPARSGGDMPPGQAGAPTARPTSLSAAVKKALGGG